MRPTIFGPVEGSTKRSDLFRLPDSPGHFFARPTAGKGGKARRYGKKYLIAYLMLVIDEWHRLHPTQPLPIGDLAEEDGSHQHDHASHDEGNSVDIYNLHSKGGKQKGAAYVPGGPQHAAYDRAATQELAMRMMGRKNVFKMIAAYHNDPDLRSAVNKAHPGWPPMTKFVNHEDHIHVTLHPNVGLTPDQIDEILGFANLGKMVAAALAQLSATAQMLRFGARGALVTALQIVMNAIAEVERSQQAKLVPDGIFGAKTHGRVEEFQSQQRLTADGIVGPKTKQAMGHKVQV